MKSIFYKAAKNKGRTSIKKSLNFENNAIGRNQKSLANFTNSNSNLNQLDMEVSLKLYIILATKFWKKRTKETRLLVFRKTSNFSEFS